MEGMNAYLELVESGRPIEDETEAPEVDGDLMILAEHARARDGLAVEGAWRLDSRVSRTLERRHETSPPGGWAGLAALACGCGVLRAGHTSFEPAMEAAELAAWSPEVARRRLLEAFTRLLVPPSTAAGLFILLGLHPAWGLRVAHATHSRGRQEIAPETTPSVEPGWRDESLFPEPIADRVEEAIFSAIGATFAALGKLSADSRYPLDALAGFVGAACRFARCSAVEQLEERHDGTLPPFLSTGTGDEGTRNFRTLDFVTVDLLDSLLVPAGAARRFDDGTFRIYEDALDGVRVSEMDREAQEVKLTWLMAGEHGCMVA